MADRVTIRVPDSTSRIVSALGTTNATIAKGASGDLFQASGFNNAVAVRYLKFYNKATTPTPGSETVVFTLALPPMAPFVFDWPSGFYFSAGIAYALTTGSADNDTGALTAADITGLNVSYT